MPYILDERQKELTTDIENLARRLQNLPNSSEKRKGDLNYAVTRLACLLYPEKSYTLISDSIAALNDAAAEIRRRRLDPYEDEAKEKNGDVF